MNGTVGGRLLNMAMTFDLWSWKPL